MNSTSNPTTHVVYFWLDNILGGYITKFSIDCTQSYNVTEREFFKGLRERFMKLLGTWINMLLCEKCMMKMKFEC
jgi:hypothetical protein